MRIFGLNRTPPHGMIVLTFRKEGFVVIYLLYAVLLLVGACILAVFASTLLFRPRASDTPALLTEEENFDKDGAVSALQQMVRCKTVSNANPALEDDAEFEKFIALLPELYPNVFKVPRHISRLKLTTINKSVSSQRS